MYVRELQKLPACCDNGGIVMVLRAVVRCTNSQRLLEPRTYEKSCNVEKNSLKFERILTPLHR